MAGGGAVRILGIDPGTRVAGFGCIEVAESSVARGPGSPRLAVAASNVVRLSGGRPQVRVVDAGVLTLGKRTCPIEDRLFRLGEQMLELLDRLKVHELAIEEAFVNRSVSAALRIGEARGVVLAMARSREVPIHQFTPARIKRAVAGHGGASKDAVAEMVCRQLALSPIPEPRDITDALAVAFCRGEVRRDILGQATL